MFFLDTLFLQNYRKMEHRNEVERVKRAPIEFQPPPPNETVDEKKKRMGIEREQYFKDLIDRKYPLLQKSGTAPTNNAEVQRRAQEMVNSNERTKGSIVAASKQGIDANPNICELNQQAERMVHEQGAYFVQMAHKARSPKASVPWFRIVGCETKTTYAQKQNWGTFLAKELISFPKQNLTTFRFNRMQPFMVCLDEKQQFDAGTNKRIIRLLGLYENEFNDQRTKFIQHKKQGLTEEEHKTRSSFFAKEEAWREAKKRHDEREKEKKKENDDDDENMMGEIEEPKKSELRDESLATIQLRNHGFPDDLKQPEFKFAVISYFRDLLAFQRCFHDLSVSLEDADFQPILIIWGLFETTPQAQEFCKLTNCNHMFLQKNLSIVDTYKWLPLDSENTQHIPIVYANKHCNEIMSYKQEEARALEEYHQWERERYGEEADVQTPDALATLASNSSS